MGEFAKRLGITEYLYRYPDRLSGGEQQRVAIARTMINRPQIILADEPTENLDTANSICVIQLIRDMCSQYGTTDIVITHDIAAADMADHAVIYCAYGLVGSHNGLCSSRCSGFY